MKIINKTKKNKRIVTQKAGFTLIETMVAVFILAISVASLMTVVTRSLFAAKYARDEITADYLLQEVVDYIRNDRDTTIFWQNSDWSSVFYSKYSNCATQNGCDFDVLNSIQSGVSTNIISCSDLKGCPLYYDDSALDGSFYNHDTKYTPTNFKRKIIVTQNVDEIKVTATVSWMNGNLPVSRSLSTTLMKWFQ